MIYFAENNNLEPRLLEQVENSNDDFRTNKDWERMKGRAVSDD